MKYNLIAFVLFLLHVDVNLKSQNLFPKKLDFENTWGYVDSIGTLKFYANLTAADSFNEQGFARVKYKNKYGYIDTAGSVVIPAVYNTLGSMIKDSIPIKGNNNYITRKKGLFLEYYFGNFYDVQENAKKNPRIIFMTESPKPAASKPVGPIKKETPKKEFKFLPNKFEFYSDPVLWEAGVREYRRRSYGFELSHMITDNKISNVGIGTNVQHQRFWGDSTKIKVTAFSTGLVYTYQIDQGFFFSAGVQPLIEKQTKTARASNDYIWQKEEPSVGISTLFYLGFHMPLSNNIHFGLKYIYVPNHRLIPSTFLKNIRNQNLNIMVSYSFKR